MYVYDELTIGYIGLPVVVQVQSHTHAHTLPHTKILTPTHHHPSTATHTHQAAGVARPSQQVASSNAGGRVAALRLRRPPVLRLELRLQRHYAAQLREESTAPATFARGVWVVSRSQLSTSGGAP